GKAIGGELRTLVVVGRHRRVGIARGQRDERRGVEDARYPARCRDGDRVLQAADVHVVEIGAAPPPDGDQRRRMTYGIATGGGAIERLAIADVAVDEAAGQT